MGLGGEDLAIEPWAWGLVDKFFKELYFQDNSADGNAALLSQWFNQLLNKHFVLLLEDSHVKDIEKCSQSVNWVDLNQAYLIDSLLNAYFSSYEVYLTQLRAKYEAFVVESNSGGSQCFDDQLLQVKYLKALLKKTQAHFDEQYAAYQEALEPYTESLALVGGMQFGGDVVTIRQQTLTLWVALEEVLLNRLNYAVQALKDLLLSEVVMVEPLQRSRINADRVKQVQKRTTSGVSPFLRYAVINNARVRIAEAAARTIQASELALAPVNQSVPVPASSSSTSSRLSLGWGGSEALF